jgi:peptidoglycan/LPS O-acetylase OafA/YrhL
MRDEHIDQLRGLSIISIIFIHCTVLYWNNSIAHTLWDYAQFAVPVILFCAGYVFMLKPAKMTFSDMSHYIIKRVKRLVLPYYGYLIFFILLLSLIKPITIEYVIRSLLFLGGWDINWLVFLFIQYIIIAPVLWLLFTNYKNLFKLYLLTVLIVSFILFFSKFPYKHLLISWIMWSPLYVYPWMLSKAKSPQQQLLLVGVLSFIMYVLLRIFAINTGKPQTMFSHKYPPDIHMLTYGFFSTSLLYLASIYEVFTKMRLSRILSFYSKHSYSLFFIHYIIIYILNIYTKAKNNLHWTLYFLIVILSSSVFQLGIIQGEKIIKEVRLRLQLVA